MNMCHFIQTSYSTIDMLKLVTIRNLSQYPIASVSDYHGMLNLAIPFHSIAGCHRALGEAHGQQEHQHEDRPRRLHVHGSVTKMYF